MKTKYSNPRRSAVIEGWPYGKFRTTATFTVESDLKRGERASRTIFNPKTGRQCQPKYTTYARRVIIVDGDDGRTYVIRDTGTHFDVMRGNLDYQHEAVFVGDEGHSDIAKLFESEMKITLKNGSIFHISWTESWG